MRLKTLLGTLAVLALLLPALVPGSAEAKAPIAAKLSPEDREDLQRIETYLNDIRTFSSPFLQMASDGSQSKGSIAISRPGQMRIEYDPPVPLLIVGGKGSMVVYDKELEQANYIPTEQTPIGVLLRAQIRLGGDLTVTRLERGASVLRLTLAKSNDLEGGSVTLIFDDRPLQLRQWVVIDPQSVETKVSLLDPKQGGAIDPKLFEFTPPARKRGGKE